MDHKSTFRNIRVVSVSAPINGKLQKVIFETEGIRPIKFTSLESVGEWTVDMKGSASFDSKGNLVKFSRQSINPEPKPTGPRRLRMDDD